MSWTGCGSLAPIQPNAAELAGWRPVSSLSMGRLLVAGTPDAATAAQTTAKRPRLQRDRPPA